MQYLPDLDRENWHAAASKFVNLRAQDLAPQTRASIVEETLRVLSEEAFKDLFSPQSRSEVAIAAVIPPPDGSGPPLKITGQIDRLAETDDEIFIVDYKTNRPPPSKIADVAPAYFLQLAAYRLAVSEVYSGGKPIRAALLWTHGPNLMEIPHFSC